MYIDYACGTRVNQPNNVIIFCVIRIMFVQIDPRLYAAVHFGLFFCENILFIETFKGSAEYIYVRGSKGS